MHLLFEPHPHITSRSVCRCRSCANIVVPCVQWSRLIPGGQTLPCMNQVSGDAWLLCLLSQAIVKASDFTVRSGENTPKNIETQTRLCRGSLGFVLSPQACCVLGFMRTQREHGEIKRENCFVTDLKLSVGFLVICSAYSAANLVCKNIHPARLGSDNHRL